MAEDLNAVERVDEFAEAVPGTPGAPEPPSRKRWRDNRTGTLMEVSRSSRTLYGDAWYRLRRNKLAMVALGWLVVLVLMALTADFWVPQHFGPPNSMDSTLMATQRLLPPSAAHPFGTDDLGRDMFSRVIYGARISLAVGTLAVLVSVFIGLLLGALSGFYHARWTRRSCDSPTCSSRSHTSCSPSCCSPSCPNRAARASRPSC
jgi:hypothetical protein